MPVLDTVLGSISRNMQSWCGIADATADCAAKTCLVHVSGNSRFPFLRLCQEGFIPLSDDPDYCSDFTRTKEQEFGFPPSAYFYAGRAHSAYGMVAMAFSAQIDMKYPGQVTTTGFYAASSPVDLICNDPATRFAFVQSSTYPLNQSHQNISWMGQYPQMQTWRHLFALFLGEYFRDDVAQYWRGFPKKEDPDGIFRAVQDWRAWTFEIRLHERIPVREVIAWCPKPDVWDEIQRHIMDYPDDMSSEAILFFANAKLLSPRGHYEYSMLIEQWVVNECGLV